MPVGHPPLICKSAAPKGGWVGFSCAFYEESESCASVLAVLYFLLVAPPSPQPLIFFFSGHDLSAGLQAALEESLTPSLLHDLALLSACPHSPRAPAASSRC